MVVKNGDGQDEVKRVNVVRGVIRYPKDDGTFYELRRVATGAVGHVAKNSVMLKGITDNDIRYGCVENCNQIFFRNCPNG